jgi:phosphoglycolate phosphatase
MTTPITLFWDIDGTLLTTARAGVYALEAALRDIARVDHDLRQLVTAGLTDAEVASLALEDADLVANDELVTAFLRAYERHLPDCLHRRKGAVMPGVVEVLEELRGRADITSLLLTGNTPAGARAKLEHYGLERFFPRGGAFCTGPRCARDDVAASALPLANGARTYVIGDTPHDVRCGNAIGAETIAVATGSYDAATLAEAGAAHVLERLPEPAAFRELVGLA